MPTRLSQPFLEQTLTLEPSRKLEALSSECHQFWQILAVRGWWFLKTAESWLGVRSCAKVHDQTWQCQAGQQCGVNKEWGGVWVSSEVGSQRQLYTVLESTSGHPRWLFWKTKLLLCKPSCALSGFFFFFKVSAACHEGTNQPRDPLSLLRSASQPLNRHGQVP